MTLHNSDDGIIEVLLALGLRETAVRHHANRYGAPTGLRIVSICDWDHREHPPVSEIARRLPRNCAVEIVFETVDLDAIWMPPRQPDPWAASMMRGRRR